MFTWRNQILFIWKQLVCHQIEHSHPLPSGFGLQWERLQSAFIPRSNVSVLVKGIFLLPLHDIWVDMLIFDPFPPQYCDVHWSWNCWCVKKFYINQCMNIIRSGLSVKETEVEDIEEYTRTLSLASIRLSTDPGCPACLWHWTWQSRKNKEKRKTERQTCPLDLSNKFIAFFFNQVCLCLN